MSYMHYSIISVLFSVVAIITLLLRSMNLSLLLDVVDLLVACYYVHPL